MTPLPLTDGCFLIDNSTLEGFTTCPRSTEYSKLRKRISAGNKPSLNFGSAIHAALEYRYKTSKNTALTDSQWQEQAAVVEAHFATNPPAEDDYRTPSWAIDVLKKYNSIYNVEPFNVLVDKDGNTLCELSFALPLFTYEVPSRLHGMTVEKIPVIYTGRIDLPVSWDGQLWVLDHKTTSMLGQSYFDQATMSAQQLGYLWAAQELTGKKFAGFVINAIRVKQPPMKPKDGLDSWWRESFQRQRFHVTDQQIAEWKINCIALVREFFFHYESDCFPMKTAWCSGKYGKCQYFDVCSLPSSSRETMLGSTMYEENTWSPLKH
jgi:hypothetical protein